MRTIGRFALSTLSYALIYSYSAWWAMVMIGIAHSNHSSIPALGYWTVLPLALAFGGTVSAALAYKDISDWVTKR